MDVLKRFASFLDSSDTAADSVRDYLEWKQHHRDADSILGLDDDIDLLSYLLHLRAEGAGLELLKERVDALKRFYQWAQTEEICPDNPFDDFDFLQPFLASQQVRQRQQTLPNNLNTHEVERLLALSQILEQLNRSVDIQSALDNTLKTLLKVTKLQTGWVSMLAESHLSVFSGEDSPSHGFTLAAAYGLPPGLEQEDRCFLRQPPRCSCQEMLVKGELTQAVNIVECSRLRDSINAAGDNQGLLYHASMPLISQGKPLGLINAAAKDRQFLTNADLHFLSTVSAQLVVALERAHFYEVAEAQRTHLDNELQVAREVQANLMPREMPNIPGYSLAGAWYPSRQVSGDFYDIFPLKGGRWGLMIGDVADKGTTAALYMAIVHSLMLSGSLRHHSPAAVLMEVNETILRQSSKGMFVTAFLAVLDPKVHTLNYVNAGHNPPLVRRADGTIESLTRTGSVVGVLDGVELSEDTIRLMQGDAVVLYTDGVTESQNSGDGDYGMDRLTSAIRTAPRKAGELLRQLETELESYTKGAPQQDDVTFLVLTRD